MLTELYGPVPGDKTVYGLAKGLVSIDDATKPQTGRIPVGCQLEAKFQNKFVENGKLFLVMNKDHAAFQTTSYIETLINQQPDFQTGGSAGTGIAKAIDQVKIEVVIPPNYVDNPALFASLLLDTRIFRPQTDTKVIINERKKAIIIGADVEIGPVAVMHKNRLIQTGGDPINQFVALDPEDSAKPKLAALVDALNALKVPAEDVIDIIKMLKHKRALFGELIIE
jgi:flagellar P-ring protein precursor FlgI